MSGNVPAAGCQGPASTAGLLLLKMLYKDEQAKFRGIVLFLLLVFRGLIDFVLVIFTFISSP